MDCPKCSYPMQEGFIPALRGPVYWAPKNSIIPLLIFNKPNGAVPLSKTAVLQAQRAEAHYCIECDLVIAPGPSHQKDKF